MIQQKSLQAKSLEREKKWPNTLEAARELSMKARAKRIEQAEQKQILQDIEERRIYEANCRAVIERAQKVIFEESDEAKKLASATLLSDVMMERDECARVKKMI